MAKYKIVSLNGNIRLSPRYGVDYDAVEKRLREIRDDQGIRIPVPEKVDAAKMRASVWVNMTKRKIRVGTCLHDGHVIVFRKV